jgi:hypothetical protein
MTKPEEWRPIPRFPYYEASSYGRIRRRPDTPYYKKNHAIMVANLTYDGYESLRLSAKSKQSKIRVHIAVAEAFLGPKPLGYEVNHKDGNKRNNALSNLEYLTKIGNIQHAVNLGIHAHGERNGKAKLTASEVFLIRTLADSGVTPLSLSKQFEISLQRVYSIRSGKAWRRLLVTKDF